MRAGQPIDVYNYGRMIRDFTYINDVVEAVIRVLDKPATGNPDLIRWILMRPRPRPLFDCSTLAMAGQHR